MLGITVLFIISKYEEIYPPDIDKFVEVTDDAYTREDILSMETDILETMDLKIGGCTVLEFFELFVVKLGLGQLNEKKNVEVQMYDGIEKTKRSVLCLARYLIELCQLEFWFLKYKASIIAAASIFMSQKLFKFQPYWYLSYGMQGM